MAINRWIKYGVSGAIGIGVLAGAATVTASAMELRTDNGTILDGGGVDANTLAPKIDPADGSKPSPSAPPATLSVATAASAPDAPTPPAPPAEPAPPVQVEQPSPIHVDPDSPYSIESADSVD